MFFEAALHSLLAFLFPLFEFGLVFGFEIESDPALGEFWTCDELAASAVADDEFDAPVARDAGFGLNALFEFWDAIGV